MWGESQSRGRGGDSKRTVKVQRPAPLLACSPGVSISLSGWGQPFIMPVDWKWGPEVRGQDRYSCSSETLKEKSVSVALVLRSVLGVAPGPEDGWASSPVISDNSILSPALPIKHKPWGKRRNRV